MAISLHARRLYVHPNTSMRSRAVRLDPYDVFACIAVIEGAGGIATDRDGNPVRLGWQGCFLAAGSRDMHAEALALLAG